MKKHLLFIGTLLFVSMLANSQTNVSGNITQNTTWTKANSPYVLVGNVGVPSTYTLTIEPGVTVQRNSDNQILVNGAIQCNGLLTDSIILSSAQAVDSNGRFFIEFQKSNLSNSNLAYISFQKEGVRDNNVRVGNESEFTETTPKNTGVLHLSHSNLSNGYFITKGYKTTASVSIDSSIVTSGYLWAYYPYAEKISLTNTQIYHSTVRSDAYSYGISLTNCYLDDVRMPLGCCGANFSFANSTVLNSKIGDDYGSTGGEGPITISNSTFTNTIIEARASQCFVTNSSFVVTTDQLFDLFGFPSKYIFSAGTLSMQGSEVINNSGNNFSGINLTSPYTFGSSDTILHNEFTNLYDAVTINNFVTIQLDSNIFSTVGRYDIVNNSSMDFSALYDYFQLNSGQTINDVIYDQNDDLSLGLVTYTPYATDSVLPVKLLSFTGEIREQSIQLNWQITNEINALLYVVQRKTSSEFTDIGAVSAAGNTGNITSYSFTDKTPVIGTNNYRLKIVDADGKYAYSPVVPIVATKAVRGLFLYPNPAKEYVSVEHAAVNNDTQLQLIDAAGKSVKIAPVTKGSTQTKLDLRSLAKGTYRIIWQTGTKQESQLLFVQ